MAEREYIERGELLADIGETVLFTVRGDAELPTSEMRGASKVINRICAIPAADVVEVRHGYWIESDNLESFNTKGWKRYKKVICSSCKKSNYNNHSNYCPNCGAKMDGKGEGE